MCVCVTVETGISLVTVWVHRGAAVIAEVRSAENTTALHCSSMDRSMRRWQNVPEFCHHHHFCTANVVLQLYTFSSALVVELGHFGLCNYRMLCSKFPICSHPVKKRDGIVQWFSCNPPLSHPRQVTVKLKITLYQWWFLFSLPPPPSWFCTSEPGLNGDDDQKWKKEKREMQSIVWYVWWYTDLISFPAMQLSADQFLDHWIGISSNMCCQLSTELAFSKCLLFQKLNMFYSGSIVLQFTFCHYSIETQERHLCVYIYMQIHTFELNTK